MFVLFSKLFFHVKSDEVFNYVLFVTYIYNLCGWTTICINIVMKINKLLDDLCVCVCVYVCMT